MLLRAFLRNFLIPATELLTRTRFWSIFKESLRFDEWDDGRRTVIQNERLSRLLNEALRSPLHQQRLKEAGLSASAVNPESAGGLLDNLSPITKTDLRRFFPSGTTTGLKPQDWRYISTAGTTDRMTVVADFVKRDHLRSSELHALWMTLGLDVAVKTIEIPPVACNIVCGLKENGPATLLGYLWFCLRNGTLFSHQARSDLRGRFERRVVFQRQTLPPIDPAPGPQLLEVVNRYLDHIVQAKPAVIRGFPVFLLWLADRHRDRKKRLAGLKVISPNGGLTSPQMSERISSGLGAPFANIYGTSEFGHVAASCGRSPGMHLFEDLFIVEIMQRNRAVAPGAVGRLVITDLVNTAMPFVRYDVGDLGRLHRDPCPCGRKTARLEVLGRTQETLETPNGILTPSVVADTFFADPAVTNFNLHEVRRGSYEAAIVGGRTAAPDLQAWRDRFAALHGGVQKVQARLVPFVRPENSGKYCFVRPLKQQNIL
jgi:phenylacetate-CoA ligase